MIYHTNLTIHGPCASFFLDGEEIIIVRDFNFKKNMGCCVYKGTYGRGTFKVYPMISDYLRNVKELIEEVLCEKNRSSPTVVIYDPSLSR